MKRTVTLSILALLLSASCMGRGAAAESSGAARPSPRPIRYQELADLLASGKAEGSQAPLLVDVRTAGEYGSGHIPGAVLFPYDEIPARAEEFRALAKSMARPIVVYCRTGRRSALAARSLADLGFTDIADFGGIDAWRGTLE